MDTNLIGKALQNIQQSYQNMQNLYNNQPNPQAKANEYMNTMNTATQKLEKQTGYNDILNQYLTTLNTYTREYSKMPLLGTLKKQYIEKTPTEDLDNLTERMMQMRDTIEARLGKLQTKQGVTVDPAKMYNLSSRLKSFYDSQIQKLQKEKEERIKSAELQAQIEYQDRVQRLRQLDNSLNNLKTMLNIARQQVKDGKMDVRNALKIQQEYDKTNAVLKKELVDAQNKLGLNMLSIWQAVKGMELKEKQTNASIAYTQALTKQINKKQEKKAQEKLQPTDILDSIGTDIAKQVEKNPSFDGVKEILDSYYNQQLINLPSTKRTVIEEELADKVLTKVLPNLNDKTAIEYKKNVVNNIINAMYSSKKYLLLKNIFKEFKPDFENAISDGGIFGINLFDRGEIHLGKLGKGELSPEDLQQGVLKIINNQEGLNKLYNLLINKISKKNKRQLLFK